MARKLQSEIGAGAVACGTCGEVKPLASFFPSTLKNGHRKCRLCINEYQRAWREANPDKVRGYSRAWYLRNKERADAASKAWEKRNRARRTERLRALHATGWKVNYDLVSRYGITADDYCRMVEDQDGRCACCGGEGIRDRRLYVDHCHQTGVIRGLLCQKCNSGIGMLGDSTDGIQRALAYLTRPDAAGIGAGLLF